MQPGQKYFLNPSPIDTPELHVRGIGLAEVMQPGQVDRPTGTGDYLFMYFYEAVWIGDANGLGWHPAGRLILWRPEDGHAYGRPDGEWRHSWFHGHGQQLAAILDHSGLPPNRAIPADAAVFEALVHELHRELGSVAPDPVIAGNLIENCLRRIARDTSRPNTAPPPRQLQELRAWMDQYSYESVTLADLAMRAGISVPHLSSEFRRYFHVSPIEYLIRQRLEHARYLLRDRNLAVGEIARRVGYEDIHYFSKLFRRRLGLSPRAYRQTLI